MILMDTSAAILVLRGQQPPESVRYESVGISTIVEMELQLGVAHGGGKKEAKRVQHFLDQVKVFDFDRVAARATANTLAKLWQMGSPIGDFDVQIAGHALALEMPLLTDNVKHFRRIAGLDVIEW